MNRATSLYLDVVRPMAAFIVLLSHIPVVSGQLVAMGGSYGNSAVDVFFVLSGFVIAHVCATREQDIRTYVVSRAARIYSVAMPALALVAIVDFIGLREAPDVYEGALQPFSPGLIIRCVFFLGEHWNAHRFPGSDAPYWSLGFEVWYYVAFGVFIFTPRRWRWAATAAILIFIGPKVAIMFPVWLMGVATYRICNARRVSPATGYALLLIPIAIMIGYFALKIPRVTQFMPVEFESVRLWTAGHDYLIGACFSMHLIGFNSVSGMFSGWLERHARKIRWFAGATFSLYLVHLPIMYFLVASAPWPKSSPWTLMLMLIVTPVLCLMFAEVSERRKEIWRRAFDSAFRSLVTPRPITGSPDGLKDKPTIDL